VYPELNKRITERKAIEAMPVPDKLYFPVSMHVGPPCTPVVAVGDYVRVGTVLADGGAALSLPVHSSVSGVVSAIAPCDHPSGGRVMAVVVDNDYEDTLDDSVLPRDDREIDALTPEQTVAIIRAAGIAGLGGAAFPTFFKIKSGLGRVDRLIINACECEPYITSDTRVALEYADEVIGGAHLLKKIYGTKKVYIGIEANKEAAINHLRRHILKEYDIKLKVLKTKYPQGSEKQLIKAVTGREPPPGGLPADVKCAVFNIDTAAAIYRAVTGGMPLIRRIVTVSGSAVANPKNLEVRIGTPLRSVFDAAGGFREQPIKILMGGPMMGIAQFSLDCPVIKSTNALLAFSEEDYHPAPRRPACIHCGKCVRVCPVRLSPVFINRFADNGLDQNCVDLNISDCIECGACSFVCPAHIPLVQTFRLVKARLAAQNKKL